MELCFQLDKAAKIVRWKVKEGNNIIQGNVIFEYVECANEAEEIQPAAPLKFKATKSGVISKILATKGSSIQKGTPLLSLNPADQCTHPIVMHDMCGVCFKDLRQLDDPQPNVASVAMVHSVPGLKVSMEEAQILGKLDEQHLLKERKLVLLVDLDQTLIHTTNDSVPHNLEDVFHFQLNSHGSVWYHTRLRPGTHSFLEKMNSLFQLHICTFGTRQYANTIAKYLDPQRKFFSDRILSRDECFNPNSKTANLKELFPRGDHMVCIIDDREDVWSYASNLIHVKPYHFFRHTGDINAPPGLTKKDNDNKDGFEFPNDIKKTESVDESTVNYSVVPEKDMDDSEPIEQISADAEHKVIESFEEAVCNDTTSVIEDMDKNTGIKDCELSAETSDVIVGDSVETLVDALVAGDGLTNCLNAVEDSSVVPKVSEMEVQGDTAKPVVPSSGDITVIAEKEVLNNLVKPEIPSTVDIMDATVSEVEVKEDTGNSEIPSIEAVAATTPKEEAKQDPSKSEIPSSDAVAATTPKEEAKEDPSKSEIPSRKAVAATTPKEEVQKDPSKSEIPASEAVAATTPKEEVKKDPSKPEIPLSEAVAATTPKEEVKKDPSKSEIPASEAVAATTPEEEVKKDPSKSEIPSSEEVPVTISGQEIEEDPSKSAIPASEDITIRLDETKSPKTELMDCSTENLGEKVEINANDADKTDSSSSTNNDNAGSPCEVNEPENNISPVVETPVVEQTKEVILTKTEDVIKIEDPDDYLLYLEEILRSIHKAYYDLFDDMGMKGKTGVPDVKTVIPYVRRKVLKGTSIVFSGVIPTQVQLEKSRQYAVAVSLGAHVSTKITPPPKPGSNVKLSEPPTTHVVAAREGTAKVNEARKRYKGIHIVTPDWLWSCAERWDRSDEKLFLLFNQTRFKRNPPAHCSSPEQTLKTVPPVECLTPIDDVSTVTLPSSVAGPSTSKNSSPGLRKERTPSGRFMDTINPLLTFSMDEIESMDHEVDDIFNESDSSSSTEDEEGRTKKERSTPRRKKPKLSVPVAQPISGRAEKDSSSNEDDTETENENTGCADTLLGKRKRSPMRTETETEDEPLSTRFRRGEPLPSDLDTLNLLSDSSDDDDGDKVNEEEDEWMAEALEREFLDENSQDTQN